MGCGASNSGGQAGAPGAGGPSAAARQGARQAPKDKQLQDWEEEEVLHWFLNVVTSDLHKHYSALLPDKGAVVARWTDQFLKDCGLSPRDAMRLVAYRDDIVLKMAGSSPAVAAPTLETPAMGMPMAPPSSGTTTAYASATITVTSRSVAPTAEEIKGKNLMEILTKGVKFAKKAVDALGPALPFPGKEAAALLSTILGMADQAITNHANLDGLRQRATAFMDILDTYHPALVKVKVYKGVVDDYMELLQGIVAYSTTYCSRNCVMRLITGEGDKEHFEELVDGLAVLTERTMVALAADTNYRVQDTQGMVGEALAHLREAAKYNDCAAKVKAAVDAGGGLDKVLADENLMKGVVGEMELSQRITLEMMTSQLAAQADKGPQRHIKQPELQLFWKKQYTGEPEVPWFAFFQDFPERLRDNPAEESVVSELSELLSTPEAKDAFRRGVEKDSNDRVNVYELRVAFSGDTELVPQVQNMIQAALGAGLQQQLASAMPAPAQQQQQQQAAVTSVTPDSAPAPADAAARSGRCTLPALASCYVGRGEEAERLEQHLLRQGSLVLLAPGGMGKSCLAADVGWRLHRRGVLAGGALWVDLREARSAADVQARFCAALGMQREDKENEKRVAAALTKAITGGAALSAAAQSRKSGCKLLMVVDNAEDALAQQEAAEALRTMLMVTAGLDGIGVRALVTSRIPLSMPQGSPYKEQAVSAISPSSAAGMVLSIAQDLTEEQADEVAAACRCVPLYLSLVAEAIVGDRMVMEDIPELAKASAVGTDADKSGGTSGDAGAPLQLVLASLKKPQQRAIVQLAVFPSAFDDEFAANIMSTSVEQAHGVLSVLYRNGLVQRGGSRGTENVIHMAVRQAAAKLDPVLGHAAAGRYTARVLCMLAEWADMFRTNEYRLALAMARDRQADLGRVAELLVAPAPPGGASIVQMVFKHPKAHAALSYRLFDLLDTLNMMKTLEAAWLAVVAEAEACGDLIVKGNILSILSWTSQGYNKAKEARERGQASYDALLASRGEEHVETLAAANILAICTEDAHGIKAAEPIYRKTLETRIRLLGKDHPDTLASMCNMAAGFHALGNDRAAEEMHREALAGKIRAMGEEHPEALLSIGHLAICVEYQGRGEEAEPLYKQAVTVQRRVLGDDHIDTLLSIFNWADCLENLGRHAEALPAWVELVERQERTRGVDDEGTVDSRRRLASCRRRVEEGDNPEFDEEGGEDDEEEDEEEEEGGEEEEEASSKPSY